MAARVAYGQRDNIQEAIDSGVIPGGSLIITNDDQNNEELFFYDPSGDLKKIHERTKFLTLGEAETWAKKYNCVGATFTIHNGASWSLYIVQDGGKLVPVDSGGSEVNDITNIDGGTAFGLA